MRIFTTILSLSALVACFQPTFQDELRCDGTACPPGFECDEGICRRDDDGIDAAVGDPFDASPDDSCDLAIECPTPPGAQVGVAVDPALEQVTLRLLAKEPEQRFASTAELISALGGPAASGGYPRAGTTDATPMAAARPPLGSPALTQTTLGAAAGSVHGGTAPPTAMGRRRSPVLPVAIVAVLAIAVGTTALVVGGGSSGGTTAAAQPPEEKEPAPPPETEPAPEPAAPEPIAPEPEAPSKVTLTIESDPAGAEIYRMPQGVRIGRTPHDVTMKPAEGEVVFLLKRRGHVDRTVEMRADRDGSQLVELERVRAASSSSRPPASTTPATRPAGEQPASSTRPAPAESGRALNPFERTESGDSGRALNPFDRK